MQKLLSYLREEPQKYALCLLSGAFLFVVLYVYEGYGIQTGESYSGHSLWARAVFFGLLTTVVFALFEYGLSKWFFVENQLHWGLWRATELFFGGSATFLLFNYFWNWTEWAWGAYFLLLGEYAAVQLLPIAFIWAWFERKSRKEEPSSQLLTFQASNSKQTLSVQSDCFLFVKSADNYVEVIWLKSGNVQKTLLRNSLKGILEEHGKSPYLMQCHRSYALNPLKIESLHRKAGKTVVEIGGQELPVSQTYQEKLERFAGARQ